MSTDAPAPLVIIGTGLAGYSLLRALRSEDHHPELLLLTADSGAVWARAELPASLSAGKEASELIVATHEQMAHRYAAQILADTRVQRIDRPARTVHTTRGAFAYSRLVLATGAEAARPSGLRGNAVDRVLTLTTLADYRYLRHELAGRHRVAVLGGGAVGCEYADSLTRAGCEVVLFEPGDRLLGGRLPPLSAARLAQALAASGVRILLEDGVQRVDKSMGELELGTLSGRRLQVDVALAAAAREPRTRLAQDAGLAVGRGIRVDASLRTSDPDIFAVGECAELSGRSFVFPEEIEAAGSVLAQVLSGRSACVQWRPRLYRLKVEACALALCEPPPVAGEWQETATPEGVTALFHDRRGDLRGFALIGEAVVAQARRLLARLGS